MEEFVGQFWHRLITRTASEDYPQAAVGLDGMQKTLGIFFRAMGGDAGLRIESVTASAHGARRRWLQRIAGSGARVELAWRDDQALRLPASLSVYPRTELNRDLYFWLAALASQADAEGEAPWFEQNQRLTRKTLAAHPGLGPRYERLLAAELARRPDPAGLPTDEAAQERAIQAGLERPDDGPHLPVAKRPPMPVPLWLHPNPPLPATVRGGQADEDAPGDEPQVAPQRGDHRRRQGQREEKPETRDGLLLYRFESILSWADYVRLNRSGEDEQDEDTARQAAEDMETMSVARDQQAASTRLRFDLDLPAADNDDLMLGDGLLLPEWDYRQGLLRPGHCRVRPMVAADAVPCELPAPLRRPARLLRNQFEALRPVRRWFRGQPEGSEVDMDAYLQYLADRKSGHAQGEVGLYRDFRGGLRDLACVLLADLSLSTDAWVSNSARVVDVIRDSLFLFAEALSATGDDFGIYGFSSRRRDHVRFHVLKDFGETYNSATRGRIQAIKPGFYTRMGAAIRQASSLLARRPASQRLLLLLTDGKPNDLDLYEGRYGAEDTRMAIMEARRQGLQPFCVTIDEEAGEYLPHLFGSGGYVVIHKPSELPRELPQLYARLTQ